MVIQLLLLYCRHHLGGVLVGLAEYFRRKQGHRRAAQAADEWWKALRGGVTVEVPAIHSTDDLTTQSILILRERHPQVICTMLQSRSIVLSIGKAGKVGGEAWGQLEKGGYFPEAQLGADDFFGTHAAFMRRNGEDPEVAQRKALEADRERHAITVVSK